MNKNEIRKKLLKIRKQNYNDRLRINLNAILKVLKNQSIKIKTIGGYYPYNTEIDIINLLEKLEKNYLISLPKIKKNFQMDFYYWSQKDPLTINHYGIPEPISVNAIYPDVLLVPLVAYDNNHNRIGYGGGFYDRYIKKLKRKKLLLLVLHIHFKK